MKKFLLVFLIVFAGINPSFALKEEIIRLDSTDFNTLKIPQTKSEMLFNANNMNESSIDTDDVGYFESDESVFENDLGKKFSKFIEEKAINNRVNKFTTDIRR